MPVWGLTCVSISSSLCLFSRSSAWASASRSLTLISSSCSSLNVFFLWLSFQRPAVRAKWRWQKVVGSVSYPKPNDKRTPGSLFVDWCLPASDLPDLWLAASALWGQLKPQPLSVSLQLAPLADVPHWCHLVMMNSSEETGL